MKPQDVVSVGEYLDNLNTVLQHERGRIIGEVSGLQKYEGKSYLFFSLRDKQDGSVINCMMWKTDYRISGVALEDGLEVVITAYPDVYKPNGRLTFRVDLVELVGEGALKVAYEKLKKKLELEGLFSCANKRELPSFPQRIGVITSRNGAVINDFLSNIGNFGFEILFVDSRVEGQEAIKELLSAIETLQDKQLDALVIMRGGGSLESFLAFNNEALVRAVATFPAPVLTGIGHDKDEPLVSLVSDKNVSTPTAVANLLNSTWVSALAEVQVSEQKIINYFSSLLNTFHTAEETLFRATDRIRLAIKQTRENISVQAVDLMRGFTFLSATVSDSILQSEKTLKFSSPERQLAFGYSIVRSEGRVVRSVKKIKKGNKLDILVSDGIIESITL